MAAIDFEGAYYSFFKVEVDRSRAFKIAAKLQQRGDMPLLSQTPKGYVVWVLEPDAQRVVRFSTQPYRVLMARHEYRLCHIQVPDLEQQLEAILFEGVYYSLFRAIDNIPQALPLIHKLSYRGDEVIITKRADGYRVWVLEPDACLAWWG